MSLFTETQAAEKVCPHIQYTSNEANIIQDKMPPIVYHQTCMGSLCISWRWAQPSTKQESPSHPVVVVKDRKGYCGIAGRPSYDD